MPGFETLEDKIKKELKRYNDEDLFWIYDIILRTNSNDKYKINLSNIETLENFNQLRKTIIDELKEIKSENEIEYCFDAIKKSEIFFIKNEILNYFKKDLRSCLFTLSNLIINRDTNNSTYCILDNLVKNKSSHKMVTIPSLQEDKFTYIPTTYIYINFIFHIFYNKICESKLVKIKEKYENKFKKEINSSSRFNDQNFVNWSYDYLMTKKPDFKRASKSCFDDNDSKLLIISYLDFLYLNDHQEHEILTMKMSKAWSQKKFRDGDKVKKNYHIPLTKKAKEELNQLSTFKNTSEAKIIEDLIHQLFLDEMCDDNGKSTY